MKWLVSFVAGLVASVSLASAQSATGGMIVGHIYQPTGEAATRAFRVTLRNNRSPLRSIFSERNGEFRFVDTPMGELTIEVTDETSEYAPVTETFEVALASETTVNIYLSSTPSLRNKVVGGGTASIAELEAQVPTAARREYVRAVRLSRAGDREGAIGALEHAISIYPEYSVAHNDLGVQFFRAGRIREAAEQFEKAIEIDKNAFRPRLNLGLVSFERRDFAKAETALREAVAIDSTQPNSHLYLGVTLIENGKLAEANEELKKSLLFGGERFAAPHFYLAVLNVRRGAKSLARDEAKAYHDREPNGELAPAAKALLSRL
jgi:Flp pilus assembly protein TadD